MTWMKPKTKSDTAEPAAHVSAPQANAPRTHDPAPPRASSGGSATIGKSVQIKGEISGSENLTIEGRIEGRIDLGGHDLRVGPNGHVQADIHAKAVLIEGEVKGDVTADDKVELSTTGSLQGDIRAPRVALANGARFKGSIDMDGGASAAASRPASKVQSGAA